MNVFANIETRINGVAEELEDLNNELTTLAENGKYNGIFRDLFNKIALEADGTVYDGGYSGRGMFGKACWGVYGRNSTRIIELAAQSGITGASYDSLGLDTIVYWPELQYNREGM